MPESPAPDVPAPVEQALKAASAPRRAIVGSTAGTPTLRAGALTQSQERGLANASLPILLPEAPELLAGAVMTSGADWYAASMPTDGATLYIHGTRLEQPGTGTSSDGQVTHPELTATLTFRRYGAAYLLEVSCSAPRRDARCSGDAFLKDLAAQLVLFGAAQ